METKELRKVILQELKKLGIKRKDYSLIARSQGCGDTYIRVTLKNPYIDLKKVKQTLEKYRSVAHDTVSHEILQGGNTFIMVRYEYGIFDEISKEYEEQAKELIEKSQYIECQEIYDDSYLFQSDFLIVHKNGCGSLVVSDFTTLATILFKLNTFGSF